MGQVMRRGVLQFTASAIALVVGANVSVSMARETASLQGRIVDRDGRPVAGAYVNISDAQYRTLGGAYSDADGAYAVKVETSSRYHTWVGKTEGYLFGYIPQSRETKGEAVDFRLSPGANIVIAAYDAAGTRLDNAQFLKETASRVFLTTMTGARGQGTLSAVHSPRSNWEWDKASPALVVVPGARYRILVQWEVPGVGKLLFRLDNDGAGYSVAKAGGRLELDLNQELASSALAALRRDHGSARAAARSEYHLRLGQAALHQAKPDRALAVREFARSLALSLAAHEDAKLARARRDIERYRKGEVTVTVVDAIGQPVRNATVTYRQTRNDFDFGANPLGPDGGYDPKIATLMRDAGINQTYLTARWGQIEKQEGVFDWSNIDGYQDPAAQLKQNFHLLGALSLWFSPMSDFSPAYLQSAGPGQLRRAVYRYGHALARRYAGRVHVWELNEFNLEGANALHLDPDQRAEIGRVFARAVKDADPDAQILNGSLALPYDVPDSPDFYDYLRAGAPTDIVGLELYQAGVTTDGTRVVGLDLVAIDRLLDRYGSLGKPLLVKEFSVPSAQSTGSSWWHRPWDQAQQAKFATGVYTLAFSKPLARGITWSWGIGDADAYIHDGGLLDRDLKPKKAYFALKALLASWRSHGRQTTNRNGQIRIRGFGGAYRLGVAVNGRPVARAALHVTEQTSKQLVIRLPATDLEAQLHTPSPPQRLALQAKP